MSINDEPWDDGWTDAWPEPPALNNPTLTTTPRSETIPAPQISDARAHPSEAPEPDETTNINDLDTVLASGRAYFTRSDDDEYVIVGRNLTPGDETTVVTKEGKEYSVIVGEVTENPDGTQIATYDWNNVDPTETIDQIIAEGGKVFRKLDDDTYVVHAQRLDPGSLTAVTARDGDERYVIIDTVHEHADGTMLGTYHSAPSYRRDPYNARKWLINGKGLSEGQKVAVPRKNGEIDIVTITSIVDDVNGWQKAEFTPDDTRRQHHTRRR